MAHNGNGNGSGNMAVGKGNSIFLMCEKNHRMNVVQDELKLKLMIKVLM